jgi:hypothetical protein
MTELPRDEGQTPLRETGVQARADAPELPADELQTPWRGDWGHEVGRAPEAEPPVIKERLFSRKVLVGWALLTLALYFGVRVVRTVIRESVRESVAAGARASGSNSRPGRVVILLPNGKRITIDRNGAEVSVPQVPPALPAPKAEPLPAAQAVPAPKIPPPTPQPLKR